MLTVVDWLGGFGGLGENGEGTKNKFVVAERSWGVKCSTGNEVNNVLITVHCVRCVRDLLG